MPVIFSHFSLGQSSPYTDLQFLYIFIYLHYHGLTMAHTEGFKG